MTTKSNRRQKGWRHTWDGGTVHYFVPHPLDRRYEVSSCGMILEAQTLWSERDLPQCKRCIKARETLALDFEKFGSK